MKRVHWHAFRGASARGWTGAVPSVGTGRPDSSTLSRGARARSPARDGAGERGVVRDPHRDGRTCYEYRIDDALNVPDPASRCQLEDVHGPAVAIVLLAPAPPLLFMGEEFAAPSPFLFFCDFGPGLAESVTERRRKEFARFERYALPCCGGESPIRTPSRASSAAGSIGVYWGARRTKRGSISTGIY